jgi:hypothetical protein
MDGSGRAEAEEDEVVLRTPDFQMYAVVAAEAAINA